MADKVQNNKFNLKLTIFVILQPSYLRQGVKILFNPILSFFFFWQNPILSHFLRNVLFYPIFWPF